MKILKSLEGEKMRNTSRKIKKGGGKVKAKLLLMVTILLMGVFVLPAQASITDVIIQPEIPTFNDDISFLISGEEGYGPIQITDAIFELNDNLITLDISLDVGFLAVVTPWSYTYDVGLLPLGTYDLTVNSFVPAYPSQNDTFPTSFEVVPEPATFLLIGTGILCLRRNKNR